MSALGFYLLVCLAFVIFALVEFAIAILLHRRKEADAGPDVVINSSKLDTENNLALIPHVIKENYSTKEWSYDSVNPKKPVEQKQMDNRWVMELGTHLFIVPSTNAIDFMAVWIYLVIFIVFNCIYWNAF